MSSANKKSNNLYEVVHYAYQAHLRNIGESMNSLHSILFMVTVLSYLLVYVKKYFDKTMLLIFE